MEDYEIRYNDLLKKIETNKDELLELFNSSEYSLNSYYDSNLHLGLWKIFNSDLEVRFLYSESNSDESVLDERLNNKTRLLVNFSLRILKMNMLDELKIYLIHFLNIAGFLFDRSKSNYYVNQDLLLKFIDAIAIFITKASPELREQINKTNRYDLEWMKNVIRQVNQELSPETIKELLPIRKKTIEKN